MTRFQSHTLEHGEEGCKRQPTIQDIIQNAFILINDDCSAKVWGSWDCDPAERMVENRRPVEPDPDNTGGGKKH
jgi:hypothetical protein